MSKDKKCENCESTVTREERKRTGGLCLDCWKKALRVIAKDLREHGGH